MLKQTVGGYRNMPAEYRLIAISLLRQRDGDECAICGQFMPYDEMTIDHIQPVTDGGLSMANNVQLAHSSCNKQRLRPHMRTEFCKRGHPRTSENYRLVGHTKSGTPRYGCRLCHNITRKAWRMKNGSA
jgi:HNH endonuclease